MEVLRREFGRPNPYLLRMRTFRSQTSESIQIFDSVSSRNGLSSVTHTIPPPDSFTTPSFPHLTKRRPPPPRNRGDVSKTGSEDERNSVPTRFGNVSFR